MILSSKKWLDPNNIRPITSAHWVPPRGTKMVHTVQRISSVLVELCGALVTTVFVDKLI